MFANFRYPNYIDNLPSRYSKIENGKVDPQCSSIEKIANALEVSPDFLLNGTIQDKAKNYIQDSELLLQFEKIEKLPEAKKQLVKEFLDAFILQQQLT